MRIWVSSFAITYPILWSICCPISQGLLERQIGNCDGLATRMAVAVASVAALPVSRRTTAVACETGPYEGSQCTYSRPRACADNEVSIGSSRSFQTCFTPSLRSRLFSGYPSQTIIFFVGCAGTNYLISDESTSTIVEYCY